MKFAMIFLVAVAAVAPPRISLNLEGMTSAYKLKDSIVRSHDLKYTQNDGSAVVSRQDWTEKCPALRSCPKGTCENGGWTYTSKSNCPFPVAKGYDHQDKEVEVTTRIYLVDREGKPVTDMTQDVVSFDKRATYLFKYDAMDKAGNKAEQVVFALILDDTQAPFYRKNCKNGVTWSPAITVEAVSDWRLCESASFDNMDSIAQSRITYKIDYLGRGHDVFKNNYKMHTINQANLKAGSTYSAAKKYFNPANKGAQTVGKFLVTASVTDFAGVYGHNAENNLRTQQQAILVRDTVAPTIFLGGNDPSFVECSRHAFSKDYTYKSYPGFRSNCKDKLDTMALGLFLETTTTVGSFSIRGPKHAKDTVYNSGLSNQLRTIGNRKITYTCSDYAGNTATKKTRVIKTVDTESPTLVLKSAAGDLKGDTHIVEYVVKSDDKATDPGRQDPGVWAKDACDTSVNTNDVVKSWGPRHFNAKKLGDYVRTYTVKDGSKNKAVKTRTFTVIDEDVPEITRMGNEVETFEASRDVEYTDKGATCHDFVDGELSHAVEVSGEVVNMRIPGTYKIQYDCQDLSGNEATQIARTVVIEDTIKPKISLLGAKINYVEAGFPYIDGGATATDTLDGDITQYIWTDGNTVNTKQAWYSKRSCQEILDGFLDSTSGKKMPQNGDYFITTELKNGSFKRVAVHCIFDRQYQGVALTYHLHHEGDSENCENLGMTKLSTEGLTLKLHSVRLCSWFRWGRRWYRWCRNSYRIQTIRATDSSFDRATDYKEEKVNFMVKARINSYIRTVHSNQDYLLLGDLDEYVCVSKFLAEGEPDRTSYIGGRGNVGAKDNEDMKIANAEQGKYVIQFHVEDKAGNHAAILYRTVVVKDTLPPVITLHLKGKLVHTGDHSQVGINHNKISGIKGNNPQFNTKGIDLNGKEYMAESATTNGWLIGAVASAVAGVALLGLSTKKTVTEVPV